MNKTRIRNGLLVFVILTAIFAAVGMFFSPLTSNKNKETLNVQALYTFGSTALEKSDSRYKDSSVFYIATAAGMDMFSESVANGCSFEGKTVSLQSNISMSGYNFQPIGTKFDGTTYKGISSFKGTFEGNSYTISNVNITLDASTALTSISLGLFGSFKNVVNSL